MQRIKNKHDLCTLEQKELEVTEKSEGALKNE